MLTLLRKMEGKVGVARWYAHPKHGEVQLVVMHVTPNVIYPALKHGWKSPVAPSLRRERRIEELQELTGRSKRKRTTTETAKRRRA
jgi:hypothetical protein